MSAQEKVKKPELERYKPGQGRLKMEPVQDDPEKCEKPKKQKRPEMARYIPKPKLDIAKTQPDDTKESTGKTPKIRPSPHNTKDKNDAKEEVWEPEEKGKVAKQPEEQRDRIRENKGRETHVRDLAREHTRKSSESDHTKKVELKGIDKLAKSEGNRPKVESVGTKISGIPDRQKPSRHDTSEDSYRPRSRNKAPPSVKSPEPHYPKVTSPSPYKNSPNRSIGRGRPIRTPEPDRPPSRHLSRVTSPDYSMRKGVADEERKAAIEAVTKFVKSESAPSLRRLKEELLKDGRNVPRYSNRRMSKQESLEDRSVSPTQLMSRPPLPPSRGGVKPKQSDPIDRVMSPTELLRSNTPSNRRQVVSRSPSPSALLRDPPRAPSRGYGYQQAFPPQNSYSLERGVRRLSVDNTYQAVPDVVPQTQGLAGYQGNFTLGQVLAPEPSPLTSNSTTDESWDGRTLMFGSSNVQPSYGPSRQLQPNIQVLSLQQEKMKQYQNNIPQQVPGPNAVYAAQQNAIFTQEAQQLLLQQQRFVPLTGIMSPVQAANPQQVDQHCSAVPQHFGSVTMPYASPVAQFPVSVQPSSLSSQYPVQMQPCPLQSSHPSFAGPVQPYPVVVQQFHRPSQQMQSQRDFQNPPFERERSGERQYVQTQQGYVQVFPADDQRYGKQKPADHVQYMHQGYAQMPQRELSQQREFVAEQHDTAYQGYPQSDFSQQRLGDIIAQQPVYPQRPPSAQREHSQPRDYAFQQHGSQRPPSVHREQHVQPRPPSIHREQQQRPPSSQREQQQRPPSLQREQQQRPPSLQREQQPRPVDHQRSIEQQNQGLPPSQQQRPLDHQRSMEQQNQRPPSSQQPRPLDHQRSGEQQWTVDQQQGFAQQSASLVRQVRGRQLSGVENATDRSSQAGPPSAHPLNRQESSEESRRRVSGGEQPVVRRISSELAAIGSWNEEVERNEREEKLKLERKASKEQDPIPEEPKDFVFLYEDIRYAKKKPPSPVEQKRGIIVIPPNQNTAEQRPSQKKESQPKNIRPQPVDRVLFDPAQGLPVNVTQPPPNISRPTGPQQMSGAQTVEAQIAQGKPAWYSPYSKSMRESRCNPFTLMDIVRYDEELTKLLKSTGPLDPRIRELQHFFMNALLQIIVDDLKFCQTENVDSHIWKMAFYNVIEGIRRRKADEPEKVAEYDELLDKIVQEGTLFYQHILKTLETTYNLSFDEFINLPQKKHHGMGMAGLALVAGQKVYIALGDLARYKEQTLEGSANYSVAKEWYSKAQLVNPKNGKPYSQLALIAMLSKRKVDAVYYYTRSLMGSNPVESAKDTLVNLFEENRKRYETQERKKREERLSNLPAKAPRTPVRQRKESEVRKELWIHPMGGRRVHRAAAANRSEEEEDPVLEELKTLPLSEVNRRLMTSFVNYQAKLYTKIGMETFQESTSLMLKEFKVVIAASPLNITPQRLLQMLALNMFSIDNTQLKGVDKQSDYRSALQSNALVISFEIFRLLIERCLQLLYMREKTPAQSSDEGVLLSAIKIWCDWLLCHSSIFNPPPSPEDTDGKCDVWSLLAKLVTFLEADLVAKSVQLFPQAFPGSVPVTLPEDAFLVGFPPLLLAAQDPLYARPESDMDIAIYCSRVQRILYVCCDFLCGLEPPVLKLIKTSAAECLYLSAVGREESPTLDSVDDGNLSDVSIESYSDGENDKSNLSFLTRPPPTLPSSGESEEVYALRQRKDELERRHVSQEKQKRKLKDLLKNSTCTEMEVHPRLLVPDTNCFVDHLNLLQQLARAGPFTLAVPLVVCKELDGLSKRGRTADVTAERAEMISNAALEALNFLQQRHQHLRCYTTKGTCIQISSRTISMEEDDDSNGVMNDDRILSCCLNLLREDPYSKLASEQGKKMVRDVVLLTDDRNLRVKAHVSDLPVRDLCGFYKWAMSPYQ